MFEPGDRVRCVNARGWQDPAGFCLDSGPEAGRDYTVSAVARAEFAYAGVSLELAEFPAADGGVFQFDAAAFRRLGDAEMARLAGLIAAPEPVAVR